MGSLCSRLLTRKTYEMQVSFGSSILQILFLLYISNGLMYPLQQMFHMSSMKMGLDQAVLQGIENSSEKDIMTKEEVEKLLKHGAYDIFKEDQEGTSEKEWNASTTMTDKEGGWVEKGGLVRRAASTRKTAARTIAARTGKESSHGEDGRWVRWGGHDEDGRGGRTG